MMPRCEIVENASSRFKCRCPQAINAPTTAVVAPIAISAGRARSISAASFAKTSSNSLVKPNRPTDTIAPEKITDTGLGATACASASQRWNGTIAALVSNAAVSRTSTAASTGSRPSVAATSPMCTMSSVPVRA